MCGQIGKIVSARARHWKSENHDRKKDAISMQEVVVVVVEVYVQLGGWNDIFRVCEAAFRLPSCRVYISCFDVALGELLFSRLLLLLRALDVR